MKKRKERHCGYCDKVLDVDNHGVFCSRKCRNDKRQALRDAAKLALRRRRQRYERLIQLSGPVFDCDGNAW